MYNFALQRLRLGQHGGYVCVTCQPAITTWRRRCWRYHGGQIKSLPQVSLVQFNCFVCFGMKYMQGCKFDKNHRILLDSPNDSHGIHIRESTSLWILGYMIIEAVSLFPMATILCVPSSAWHAVDITQPNRCKTQCTTQFCSCVSTRFSKNKPSRHLVGTLTSHWRPLL